MKNARFFVFFLAIVALYSGCGEISPFRKNIKEGIIEFEVSYPEMDPNNLMIEMLPNRMVMTFKGDKTKSVLSTAAGIVEMSVISDSKKKELISLAKIFSDRYMLRLDHQDAIVFSNVLPPFDMNFTGDHEKLADAKCERVELTFRDGKREPYVFLYTNDLDVNDPNWFSPYSDIKGVLLDYRAEHYNINMHLKAVSIVEQEVSDAEFDIDSRYRELTADQFQELVVKNMEMFNE